MLSCFIETSCFCLGFVVCGFVHVLVMGFLQGSTLIVDVNMIIPLLVLDSRLCCTSM